MNSAKKKRLESAGFRVGDVQDFLELSPHEIALIDVKARLTRMLRPARIAAGISQGVLAERIGSSQSRVGKMEAASPDVSLDLICKALLALGITRQAIGKTIAARRAA